MQITLLLKANATVPGEAERHESVSGTAAAAGAAQPSCTVLCWGWAGGSKPRAGSLERRREGTRGSGIITEEKRKANSRTRENAC